MGFRCLGWLFSRSPLLMMRAFPLIVFFFCSLFMVHDPTRVCRIGLISKSHGSGRGHRDPTRPDRNRTARFDPTRKWPCLLHVCQGIGSCGLPIHRVH